MNEPLYSRRSPLGIVAEITDHQKSWSASTDTHTPEHATYLGSSQCVYSMPPIPVSLVRIRLSSVFTNLQIDCHGEEGAHVTHETTADSAACAES